jgi:hypothetical protein
MYQFFVQSAISQTIHIWLKNVVSWVVMPDSSGFLLEILEIILNPEDVSAMFLQNIGLSPNYMALQPRNTHLCFIIL